MAGRGRPLDERRLTYPEVGATAGPLPAGYHHLRRCRTVGTGGAAFRAAASLARAVQHRVAQRYLHAL